MSEGTSGESGEGGFGGFGGGGGAGNEGRAGGFGGGGGSVQGGGGGAGFGGALFVRSGTVDIQDSAFEENAAYGAAGGGAEAGEGSGYGGGIFALDTLSNSTYGNDQGMPTTLPAVTGCGNAFVNNIAEDGEGGPDDNNDHVYGVSQSALEAPCQSIPVTTGFGQWLLGLLLAAAGWLGIRSRR